MSAIPGIEKLGIKIVERDGQHYDVSRFIYKHISNNTEYKAAVYAIDIVVEPGLSREERAKSYGFSIPTARKYERMIKKWIDEA